MRREEEGRRGKKREEEGRRGRGEGEEREGRETSFVRWGEQEMERQLEKHSLSHHSISFERGQLVLHLCISLSFSFRWGEVVRKKKKKRNSERRKRLFLVEPVSFVQSLDPCW